MFQRMAYRRMYVPNCEFHVHAYNFTCISAIGTGMQQNNLL